eukprot:2100103-Pyramimonas_sp.AAC.1
MIEVGRSFFSRDRVRPARQLAAERLELLEVRRRIRHELAAVSEEEAEEVLERLRGISKANSRHLRRQRKEYQGEVIEEMNEMWRHRRLAE